MTRRGGGAIRVAAPAALILSLLIAWEAVCRIGDVSARILPSPTRILSSAIADSSNLAVAIRATGIEGVLGSVIGVGVGMVAAYALAAWPLVRRSVYPLLVASQAVPVVAIAPLMIIWFGFDMGSKVLLVAVYTLFPVTVGLLRGLDAARPSQIALVRSLGAGTVWTTLHVRTMAALPQLLSGIRVAITYAFATAAMAEFLGARHGLGIYLLSAQASFRTDLVFSGAIVLILMTVLFFAVVSAIEWALFPWLRTRRGMRRPLPAPKAEVYP